MRAPAREAWRRLPWRRWIAGGILLGLAAASVLGVVALWIRREWLLIAHPGLADTWILYLGLGGAQLLALVALLARRRHALRAVVLLSALIFAFEALQIGLGLHLLRLPAALLLVLWADRQLPAGRP